MTIILEYWSSGYYRKTPLKQLPKILEVWQEVPAEASQHYSNLQGYEEELEKLQICICKLSTWKKTWRMSYWVVLNNI